MSMCEQTIKQKKRQKRKNEHPGIIDSFLADSNESVLSMKLYSREIRRIERKYPDIIINKDRHFNTTDLWECTITKRK